MPEMPEVETVRRTLRPLVVGKTIDHVDVWYDKVIAGDPETFKQTLRGKTFTAVDRYGKFLLFRLGDLTLVSHLRMEGKYHLTTWEAPVGKHEHLQFAFTDGSALRYQDVRKFGRLQLVETGTEFQQTGLKRLGAEAGSPDFSLEYFEKGLKKKSKKIKNLLLDQTLVAGLGNIYADEVLWQSKINPLTPADELTPAQVKRLYEAINKTVEEATRLGGTTVHSFLNAAGEAGHYQEKLQVYGHAGQACPRCGEKFVKIKVSGRGTTYCPFCQKEEK
ncbi:formamidopyrimidine-DNA glycosylase [Lactobacillus nasalidis]|uniref:Formamidopyrimidine-DNA glycosylase n=1 Tax=Lactobacillus nasalidis TaxID=2797258 RepID=A0ABQ3W9E3_9LACO|nr:DNA-formamidopyrimidine glycosylase [Lactobacillus nasalidis]GHV98012.1 formamidopyrimidine-DNA glycosylase [Lactobacillus nasalidis]GHV99267.1 formamidopyrimidine-DNA glycosylase [Lactobacillus nasalidis]GHW02050.1 formamidopyrimidine-DNA glycosylase [Lactobacillus nasalidis]